MVTGAVFCPHPPVLIPDVAQGAAAELDALRAACRTAILRLAAPGRQWVVLGSAPVAARYPASARGSLAGYGVDVEIPLGVDGPGSAELPLSLTVGAWLLRDALGPNCRAVGWSVDRGRLGDEVAADTAVLVMGDGSARRSTAAPGYLDDRAAAFDAGVAAALRSGDPNRLRVDTDLGDGLLAAGPRAWAAAGQLLGPATFDAELLYEDAPYGVGYFVAVWTARG